MKVVTFFKEIRGELEKVVWPKQGEVIKLTAIVIFISVLVAAIVGGMDYVFASLLETILS